MAVRPVSGSMNAERARPLVAAPSRGVWSAPVDLGFVLLDYGDCPGCPSDLDGNGIVDAGDVSIMLLLFG